MTDAQITEQAILDALAELKDPETGRDLVKLKQIRDVQLDEDHVELTLALTTHSAPLWEKMAETVREKLRERFSTLGDVTVHLAVHERPPQKLGEIGLTAKSVIAVGSGKGGVGKSTVAVNMAWGLKRAGSKVGLLDADVYGPSIPHLLGTEAQPMAVDKRIQPVLVDGMPVMSMGMLVPKEEAVIWRGPMLHGALTQFLRDTQWGDLDYLIVDMPPGTGDVAISLAQLLPVSGSVVVCTPQEVALLDAVKAVNMFRKVDIPVLGMIENMSGFVCPHCQTRYDIFDRGGVQRAAERLDVPFLGEVPIHIRIRELGDAGRMVACFDDDTIGPCYDAIARRLVESLAARSAANPVKPSFPVLG